MVGGALAAACWAVIAGSVLIAAIGIWTGRRQGEGWAPLIDEALQGGFTALVVLALVLRSRPAITVVSTVAGLIFVRWLWTVSVRVRAR
jgi:hypothetical protein